MSASSPPASDDRRAVPLAAGLLAPHGADLVLAEWRDPGGGTDPPRYIAPLHTHASDDEAWYLLEGALRFRLGEDTVEATAGGAVLAPRGTPHTYWNPRPEPARYLLVMTATIRALIDAIHALEDRSPAAMEAVFRAHDSGLIGWP
jgi:mannose-6-phosphate isomerase-like protein (cupin superfamily)